MHGLSFTRILALPHIQTCTVMVKWHNCEVHGLVYDMSFPPSTYGQFQIMIKVDPYTGFSSQVTINDGICPSVKGTDGFP